MNIFSFVKHFFVVLLLLLSLLDHLVQIGEFAFQKDWCDSSISGSVKWSTHWIRKQRKRNGVRKMKLSSSSSEWCLLILIEFLKSQLNNYSSLIDSISSILFKLDQDSNKLVTKFVEQIELRSTIDHQCHSTLLTVHLMIDNNEEKNDT